MTQRLPAFWPGAIAIIFVFGFSPDGRYLATTHFPGFALTVWDIENRTVAVSDPGPVAGGAAQFSPDSRRVALCHADGDLLVYDLATGRPMRRWRMPTPGHIAFRPDGAQMAILQKDPRNSTCRIVEAESGRVLRSIPLPNLPLVGVVWSPDGTTLATPSDDQKIYLWDAATGNRKATLEGHTNAGLSVAFHPTGTLLASNGWERRLRLWDAALGRPVLSLSGDHYYFHAGFSQDGRIVVSVEDRLTTY